MNLIKKIAILMLFFSITATAATVTPTTDPDKTIVVKADQPEFTLRLAANPTTGYTWFIKRYNSHFLTISKHQYLPPTSQIVGAGGVDLWVFKVNPEAFVAPHIFKLKFIYARGWDLKDNGTTKDFYVVTQK